MISIIQVSTFDQSGLIDNQPTLVLAVTEASSGCARQDQGALYSDNSTIIVAYPSLAYPPASLPSPRVTALHAELQLLFSSPSPVPVSTSDQPTLSYSPFPTTSHRVVQHGVLCIG